MTDSEGRLYADDGSILTVSNILSADECAGFVDFTERQGYAFAPITAEVGAIIRPEIRNNGRVMVDDMALAKALWDRLARWIPAGREGWSVIGLNERFRYYRYDVGEYFRWHRDGAFMRSRSERSMLTAMVYLNDDFDGGTTDFEDGISITPRRGSALLFEHGLRHQGAAVTRGRKYVLRSDVMFQRS